jgi:hypothetical protein
MSAKTRVWALAVLVVALASGVIWEIIHRKDEPSRRPAAVASALPAPRNPDSSTTAGAPAEPDSTANPGESKAAPPSQSAGTTSNPGGLIAQTDSDSPLRPNHPTETGGTHIATGGATHTARGGTHTLAGNHGWTAHPWVGGHAAAGGHPAAANRGSTNSPSGTRNVSLKGGGHASVRSNGSVLSADRNGTHVERGLHGWRTSMHDKGHGERVFAARHGGYVQHAYVTRGGRSFYSRTYVVGGVVHVGVYQGYFWGGRTYYVSYPTLFYAPAFYGWAFQGWRAPVVWSASAWGWGGPWWGFYGGWFTPYPVYSSATFWLTDDLLASNLQTAYAAHESETAAAASAGDAAATDTASADSSSSTTTTISTPATLTPEVKQAIAEEVKAQLAAQQALAAQGGVLGDRASAPASGQVPPALDPAHRTFVVGTDVTAVMNGTECGLTAGDVVTRLTDTPDATDNTVNASVSANKKGDCASGATVAVKVEDLQEMYNHFQEQLINGLGELAKKQGTNGMPKAPDTKTTASDVPAPEPDPNAAQKIKDENADADKVEADVKAEAAAGGGL